MTPIEVIDWLLLPLSGGLDHVVAPRVSWHGRLMVLAWGVAVPVAVLLARFFKVTPRQRWPEELDNTFWWHGHRFLSYVAVTLTVIAAALIMGHDNDRGPTRTLHAWAGWMVLSLAAVQIVSAHLRGTKGGPTAPRLSANGEILDLRGDHYDMTPHRRRFEWIHKTAGMTAVVMALAAMLTGLWTADALRWMWAGLVVFWFCLLAAFVRWQRQGRCLDTYQAIWGPGLEHPGNSMQVVGFGIRRVKPPE